MIVFPLSPIKVMILGVSPKVLKLFCSRSSSSCISFSSRCFSLRPVSLRILSIVAFSWASICFFRYCFRLRSFSYLRITSVASSTFLFLRGRRSGSWIKSLVYPFWRLVWFFRRFLGEGLESISESRSSASSSLSESQLSEEDSDSAASSSSSCWRASQTSCCCSWSISLSSSSSFSTSMSLMLSLSSSSDISSSEARLLSLLPCLLGFPLRTSGSGSGLLELSWQLSCGILSASVRGRYAFSCAQCSFWKQKPRLMVTLVDICQFIISRNIPQAIYPPSPDLQLYLSTSPSLRITTKQPTQKQPSALRLLSLLRNNNLLIHTLWSI